MPGNRRLELKKVTKFAAVGAVNTAVDVSIFAGLVQLLDWGVVPANLVSYGTGILNSFFLNKFWTFRDTTPLADSGQPFLRFCLFNLSSLLLSTLTVAIASLSLAPLGAKALSVLVVFAWNYLTSRIWVFASEGE